MDGNGSGLFNLKKFREYISVTHVKEVWGKKIWQEWIPEKITLFIWRLILNFLPVESNIKKLGINVVSRCVCCNHAEETPEHLFFKGDWAETLWRMLSGIFGCTRPFSVENHKSKNE